MRQIVFAVLLSIMAVPVATAPAAAGTIQKACMSGERRGNMRLCACIQAAADRTLSRQDQRLAASFFKDPDKAQEIRQSDRRAHEAFWQRYKAFGQTAEAFCS